MCQIKLFIASLRDFCVTFFLMYSFMCLLPSHRLNSLQQWTNVSDAVWHGDQVLQWSRAALSHEESVDATLEEHPGKFQSSNPEELSTQEEHHMILQIMWFLVQVWTEWCHYILRHSNEAKKDHILNINLPTAQPSLLYHCRRHTTQPQCKLSSVEEQCNIAQYLTVFSFQYLIDINL